MTEQTQTKDYLESFRSSSTVESQTEVDFVVLFQDLKTSFFPPGGAQVQAGETDLNSATAGEFGHYGCHGFTIQLVHFGGWDL